LFFGFSHPTPLNKPIFDLSARSLHLEHLVGPLVGEDQGRAVLLFLDADAPGDIVDFGLEVVFFPVGHLLEVFDGFSFAAGEESLRLGGRDLLEELDRVARFFLRALSAEHRFARRGRYASVRRKEVH
jgi:hypothetical protein